MAPGSTLEEFVVAVHARIEAEAAAHADDRWWVLEPLLLSERRGALHALELRDVPQALRALHHGGPASLPEALDVRRAAVALHVDLARGEDIAASIVVVVAGQLLTAVQVARVHRTDLGT